MHCHSLASCLFVETVSSPLFALPSYPGIRLDRLGTLPLPLRRFEFEPSRGPRLACQVTFVIVPMLNPDGTFLGNYRTDALGNDLNRLWGAPTKDMEPALLYTKVAFPPAPPPLTTCVGALQRQQSPSSFSPPSSRSALARALPARAASNALLSPRPVSGPAVTCARVRRGESLRHADLHRRPRPLDHGERARAASVLVTRRELLLPLCVATALTQRRSSPRPPRRGPPSSCATRPLPPLGAPEGVEGATRAGSTPVGACGGRTHRRGRRWNGE